MRREGSPRERSFPGKIKSVEPGDLIRERKSYQRETDGAVESCTYRVLEIYPCHVLTEDTVTGFLRCISYGDLIVMGLEKQEPRLEALKYNRKEPSGRRWRSE